MDQWILRVYYKREIEANGSNLTPVMFFYFLEIFLINSILNKKITDFYKIF